jgi:hypothetical protein
MRLVFFFIYFGCSSLIFSQNELLLPVQEITEINPAVTFHYQKPSFVRMGIYNNFQYLMIMSPIFYNYSNPTLHLQYQGSSWSDKSLNNNVLSLNYGKEIQFTRNSNLGIGAKIKGYNLTNEASLSGDLGLIFYRKKILLSYTLINPLSLGNTILETTHHFYGNAKFYLNAESGGKSDNHYRIKVEPIFMASIFSHNTDETMYKVLLKLSYKKIGLIGGKAHNRGDNSVLLGTEYTTDYFSIIIYNQFTKNNTFQPSLKIRFTPPTKPHKRMFYNPTPIVRI